jgi:AbrB family looped-hinge helix DNA binding protein
MYIVSITSQGQISIPASVQKELGLKKPSKAIVKVEGGRMVVEPVKDFFDLKGSLKTNKKPLSNKELHDMFAEYTAKEAMGLVKK